MTDKEKRAWIKNYLVRTPVQKDGKKVTLMFKKMWGLNKEDKSYENAKEIFEI